MMSGGVMTQKWPLDFGTAEQGSCPGLSLIFGGIWPSSRGWFCTSTTQP